MSTKKNKTTIPLLDVSLSAKAKSMVAGVLDSGWLTTGPRVKEFEQAIAKRCGVRYAAGLNSASAGLQLTLTAMNVVGKEVLTSPFTFVATVEAIIAAGAKPVLVDIDPGTLNIDPEEVVRKISNKTAILMPVDIGGLPADYDLLNKICLHYSFPLISDSAQSFGAGYKKKPVPRQTDASIYSLHSTKNLTCGEGGMVVSKHKVLIEKIKKLSQHSISATVLERKKRGDISYDVDDFGYKANLSDIQAAIGLGQLSVFDAEQEKRKKIVKRYFDNLSDLSEQFTLPVCSTDRESSNHLFIIKFHLSRLKIDRNRFILLMAQRGIECGVHFKPVFELTFYGQYFGDIAQYFPNTTYAGRRVVSLPMYARLKLTEVDYICEVIKEIVSKHKK